MSQQPAPVSSAAPAAPVLVAQEISKRFGAVEVLKGVSLTAHAGDVISMIGASGSGKSTFLRCLNLLERPSGGRITLASEELKLAPNREGELEASDVAQLRRLRSRVAMVFQQFNLWSHMTALENVIEAPMQVLGLSRAEAVARAGHYLDRVGVSHRKDAYPAFLSGGEQQRVAIARALAMEPALILFDEPTSALDPELVGEVLGVMRSLADEGRTMIVVTHEMSFAQDVSKRVVFLHAGRIEEEGKPREVFANPASERLRGFLANTRR
ncbi:MAG: ABC transporter ATP-binding protein [Bosea sp. (in: a-proteobacteria)]